MNRDVGNLFKILLATQVLAARYQHYTSHMRGDVGNSERKTPNKPARCARDIVGTSRRSRDQETGYYPDVEREHSNPKRSHKNIREYTHHNKRAYNKDSAIAVSTQS